MPHTYGSESKTKNLHSLLRLIQNQEVAHNVDILLKALENPSVETDGALEALLFTRFVTVLFFTVFPIPKASKSR